MNDACYLLLAAFLVATLVAIYALATRSSKRYHVLDELIDEASKAEAGKLTLDELKKRLEERGIGR